MEITPEWKQKVLALSSQAFKEKVIDWSKRGRFDLMRTAGKLRLEHKGYVDLGHGSVYRWLEKDMFEKAKAQKAIMQVPGGRWLIGLEDAYLKFDEAYQKRKYAKYMEVQENNSLIDSDDLLNAWRQVTGSKS